MLVENLNFYDKFGKNLNLDWNEDDQYWQGTIYFPITSVNLYDNENIFILEEDLGEYKFPKIGPGESIEFKWKNTNVEENLFIYEVEDDLELNNKFINPKDSLTITYDDLLPSSDGVEVDIKLPLQLNIAFNPVEEEKYERVLVIYKNDDTSPNLKEKLAEIKFYGEAEGEDVRFSDWTQNFGIKFNKEDANILKEYDIKEANPNMLDLNAARKSLLVNKDQVFPYIGTYKGLSNFINLLGYKDVLQIKEYWKNINENSPYFEKTALVDITDYLDDGKIDNINILDKNKNIKYGNQFKKTECLALVYQFTRESGKFDDDGIPEVEETTTFTVDEMFYKLNLLKKKVKNEIIPINVRIKEIIGEFIYFQKITIKFWKDDTKIFDFDLNEFSEVKSYPNSDVNLIIRSLNPLLRKEYPNGSDFGSVILNSGTKNPFESNQKYKISEIPTIIEYIEDFYDEIKVQKYPKLEQKLTWEDGDDPERIIGAPVVLNIHTEKFTFSNFKGVTFEDLDSQDVLLDPYFTLDNLDFKNFYEITWKISKDSPRPYTFEYRGKISDLNKLPHFLPYVGRYRVTAELHDFYGNTSVFSKFINVEGIQKPHIVAVARLEDKFKYKLENLSNVRLIDFGTSYNYKPKVNVLDSEDAITKIDIYKNLLEWQWFYKNGYGLGQKTYDVEIYDEDSNSYLSYDDPLQSHPKKEYWGLGTDRYPIKLQDFNDVTLDSLFFMRFEDLIYTDNFKAGFYLQDPRPGQEIQMSLFSSYVIPSFTDLENLVEILNDSNHPGIRLFNYEIIRGRESDRQFVIHAQAEYLSKEMYHILADGGNASPSPKTSSPSSGLASIDKYTFFHPKEVYSKRLVEYFKSNFPIFDEETLFMFSKT